MHPMLYLGIDTGGTYTDGVLLDAHTRKVLNTVKVLTTHHDLKLGIADVLRQLIPADPTSVAFISLSTTLATNAIAEGKRKSAALFLLGYDSKLVQTYNFQEQFGTDQYFYVRGRHNLNGVEQTALDENSLSQIARRIQSQVDACAVASYAGPMNSSHEERAGEILADLTDLPIVQAHHLSSELDSIRRATTASLNASLLSNVQEFVEAVQGMAVQFGLRCPIMMIKGDGAMVHAEWARKRPVEIIHSGPATSSIGGQFLAGVDTALVIDIGGTTTDIAMVDRGNFQILEKAATVGSYRTCVQTIKTRSFGLGGDSQIHFDRYGGLTVGPERLIPLSFLCHQYPEAKKSLLSWLWEKQGVHYPDQIEFWVLRREPKRPLKSEYSRQAVELLRAGPQLLPRLLKKVGVVSSVHLYADDLVKQEVIDRVGLTPTDLLHVTGEFTPWDAEVAREVVERVARNWQESVEAFVRRVRQVITRRVVAEVIEFLSGKRLSDAPFGVLEHSLDRWLYDESLESSHPHLGSRIFLKVPLVGIGAPARAFLPAVAEALGTECILPEYYAVANAVGTVVANITIHQEGEVFPAIEGTVTVGYFARVDGTQRKFAEREAALSFAREALIQRVTNQAAAAGADNPQISFDMREWLDGTVRLLAWAVGKPKEDGNFAG